jgi:hypothetical protein
LTCDRSYTCVPFLCLYACTCSYCCYSHPARRVVTPNRVGKKRRGSDPFLLRGQGLLV